MEVHTYKIRCEKEEFYPMLKLSIFKIEANEYAQSGHSEQIYQMDRNLLDH